MMQDMMAERGTLAPKQLVERLNRSVEEELSRLEDTFPTTRNSPLWGYHVSQDHGIPGTVNGHLDRTVVMNSSPTSIARTTKNGGASAVATRNKANANNGLFSKLEASRIHALEALSSVLFENCGDGEAAQSGSACDARPATTTVVSPGEERRPKGERKADRATQPSLEDRLRSKATALVEEEKGLLLRELRAELDSEKKLFAARKPTITEEGCRSARLEQASALQKQERELRMILARRELKNLKDATYSRLAVAHAQEKERMLSRLRRSLSRGTGHSVGGLRESLWEEAQQKRTRALKEGEVTFEHLRRLLRQQWEQDTQIKIEAMAEEAKAAEEAALAALRKEEVNKTEEELSQVLADLKQDKANAEANLKHQLQAESTRSVTAAVDTCSARHKVAQQDAATRASETLKRALQAAAEDEDVRTKTVLEREKRCLDERKLSLVTAAEEALSACSLGTLAERSRLSPMSPPSPTHKPRRQQKDVGKSGTPPRDEKHSRTYADFAAAVRRLEGAANAAERAYAKRARGLVRLRAAAALSERQNDGGSPEVVATSGAQVEREARRRGEIEGGEAGCCGGCAVLFEANERLLEEARSHGFLS